jgi:hypothetical protein
MTHYFDTPKFCVALNAKCGSSSLARAIIRQFQPRQEWLIRTAAFPAGKTAADRQWHWMCKGKATPDKPVVLLVRDPVERFASACQQTGQEDIDAAIDSLVKDKPVNGKARMGRPGHLRDDVHFCKQSECVCGETHLFRFPDHLPQAAALIGLEGELPKANEAKRPKPKLTKAQEAKVRAYYAEDQSLFESIKQPGKVKKV